MPSGSVGTVSAKLAVNYREWKGGLRQATMSLRTHGRQGKKIFAETRTAAESYRLKVAELSAMYKKQIIPDMETYRRKLGMVRREYLATAAAAGKMGKMTAMVGRGAGSIGAAAAGYLAPMAAVGAGMGAARRAEGIRQAMRSSQAIMGDLSPEVKAGMSSAATQAASGTKFSTQEASESFFFLASAGLDAKQSIAALPTVAKFAQAGMFDLSRATDLLTDSQMALGMTSQDTTEHMRQMTHVGDVLVGANTIANASVQQFAEALTNKAAGALRMVNKDIEEGVAWLAVYAAQGIKGADAGTALGIVLRDLQTKAIKNASAFADLKIKVFDTDGAMRNMADIVGDMETAMSGMSAEGKKAALMYLGLSDKSVAYTQVLLGMADTGRAFEDQLRSMGGTMDKISGKQLTDFAKGWERVKAAWDSMATGPIGRMMDSLGRVMEKVAAGKQAGIEIADIQKTGLSIVYDATMGPLGKAMGMRLPSNVVSSGSSIGGDVSVSSKTGAQQQRRANSLDHMLRVAYQKNLDTGRQAEMARARGAQFRGGLLSAAKGTASDMLGLGGIGNTFSAIGQGGAGSGSVARWLGGLAFQGSNVDLAKEAAISEAARKTATAARERVLKPLIDNAMSLLGAGTDGAALRFASADVYGSQAATSAIARAMAPGGVDSRKRTEESILLELQKEREENREMLRIARRIAEKLAVPTEIDVPP